VNKKESKNRQERNEFFFKNLDRLCKKQKKKALTKKQTHKHRRICIYTRTFARI